MKLWITKNIKFGYKYSDKDNRNNIINSTKWLINLIKSKLSPDDIFILSGGLFSSNNPSVIAINDAHEFLKELSTILPIYLVNSSRDIKIFDNITYSTLDIFKDIQYITIIKDVLNIYNISIIPYGETYQYDFITLDVEKTIFNKVEIPSLIQLNEDESNIVGILVYKDLKQIFIENNISPKHKHIFIKNIEELKDIKLSKDLLYLTLDKELLNINKVELDIELFKLNPVSVKYTEVEEITKKDISIKNTLNIKEIIMDNIKDEKIKSHFDKILEIYKTK